MTEKELYIESLIREHEQQLGVCTHSRIETAHISVSRTDNSMLSRQQVQKSESLRDAS